MLQLLSACDDLGGVARLAVGGIGFAIESASFSGEKFVVGGRGCQVGRIFAGQK